MIPILSTGRSGQKSLPDGCLVPVAGSPVRFHDQYQDAIKLVASRACNAWASGPFDE